LPSKPALFLFSLSPLLSLYLSLSLSQPFSSLRLFPSFIEHGVHTRTTVIFRVNARVDSDARARGRTRWKKRRRPGVTERSFGDGELRGDSVARSEGCYDKGLRYLSGGDRQINEKGSHEREED